MNQKGFVNIILVLVIVVLVGAVGYFALTRKQEPVTSPATTPPPAATQAPTPQTPTPTAIADGAANWQAYQNSKYGFEFKYPETARVGLYSIDGFHSAGPNDNEMNVDFQAPEGEGQINITVSPQTSTYKECLNKVNADEKARCLYSGLNLDNMRNAKDIKFAGAAALQVDFCNAGNCSSGVVNRFVNISYNSLNYGVHPIFREPNSKYRPIIDSILATFKFTR